MLAKSLEDAGIPLDRVGTALQQGAITLDFMDAAAYERFASLAGETFREASDRTGVPLDLVMAVREAVGSAPASPDDRMRNDELAIVPFLELQVGANFNPTAIDHLLRVLGESTGRMADAEGAWWNSEVMAPALAAGKDPGEIANTEFANRS